MPEIGDTLPGGRGNPRMHYNAAGKPKKALTPQEEKYLLALQPECNVYTCNFCGKRHLGNSDQVRFGMRMRVTKKKRKP
jgi:hypothetical protein